MNQKGQKNQMNQVQNDEIELFELFQTLWDGKWLISAFVAVALLLGGGLIFSKDAAYESRLNYSIDTVPPFYGEEKVSRDFQKMFYSINIFEEWKETNSNTSVVFENFSATEVVDGFVVSKAENARLAILSSKKVGGSFLLVKSRQLPVLDGFFKYANHINELLKIEYVSRAKEELNIIEARFKGFSTTNENLLTSILSIDRYIVAAEKGAKVLSIQRPTMPGKVSPSSFLILAQFVVLGGVVGAIFVLILNAFRKRKASSAKA